MCGIVACATATPALRFLLPALRTLEYRGYDSAGVAVQSADGRIVRFREVGGLAALAELVDGSPTEHLDGVGIGHTRWATHGVVTRANAHPHADCRDDVHVVHNGIIDNADALRRRLMLSGHRMASDVDTEVVAHLVEEAVTKGVPLPDAVAQVAELLTGSWALAVMRRGAPCVVVTAQESPLLVGVGPEGAFATSDLTALSDRTDDARVVADGEVLVLHREGIERRGDAGPTPVALTASGLAPSELRLTGHPDYMSQEIAAQAPVLETVADRFAHGIVDGSLWRDTGLPDLRRVRFVCCGTSLNAARVLARVLGRWGVPSTMAPASELAGCPREDGTVEIALSQSGETADVLHAIDATGAGDPLLALTNVGHSTLARKADAVVLLGAGPEIGVAATKTFAAQVAVGSAVLLSGLRAAGVLTPEEGRAAADLLYHLPEQVRAADELAHDRVPALVDRLQSAPGFLYVARGDGVPYAYEGALKLTEISYRWTECQPAGELKHGPIALIEPGTPVVVVDDGHPKLGGSIAEVRARRADVVVVGGPDSEGPYRLDEPDHAPWGPLASVVVLQHLARSVAIALGRDVDKPRNLAKSVTVE